MSNDQCRFIQLLDDICHREGFSGAGDTEKCLALVAFLKTFDKIGDRLGLVAGGNPIRPFSELHRSRRVDLISHSNNRF